MSYVIGGNDVWSATVVMPQSGVWTADVQLANMPAASVVSPATLTLDALELTGTVERQGAWQDVISLRLVGGGGGFGKVLAPRSYRMAPASLIVADILGDAGEALSGTAMPLGMVLPAWTRLRQGAGAALAMIAAEIGYNWRVLPNGTVWLGTETWPELVPADHTLLQEVPDERRSLYACASLEIVPGVTVEGRRVSYLEHRVDAEKARTSFWWGE